MSDGQQADGADASPIAIVVKQTGLPSTLKGHAQRLIMRWLAGTIAHPYFLSIRENLDTIEGRSRVSMMLADEVGRQAVADPAQVERAKARFLGDLSRKQENVEAIAAAAATKVEQQPGSDDEPNPLQEPSPDWMNAFTREAEDASSEQLRERLASILAGEIKRPGTFSRSALRLVGELEQDTLLKFQQVLANRVGRSIFVPTAWGSGDMLLTGLELSELGLLSGVGTTNHQFAIDATNNAFMLGSAYGLVLKFQDPVPGLNVTVWVLSKTGSELAQLLPTADERVPLRQLATEINKTNIRQIAIGRAIPSGVGMISVTNDEFPYTAPAMPVSPLSAPLGLLTEPMPPPR